MKKITIISAVLLGMLLVFNTPTFGQSEEGRIQIGPGLAYGGQVDNIGISFDGYYTINEQFRAGAALTYFFPDETDFPGGEITTNYFGVDLNGNYIFHHEDELMAYAIAGLNLLSVNRDADGDADESAEYSDTELGLNLGVGAEYAVDFGNLFGELKLAGLGGDADQLVLGVGVRFDIQ